MLHVRAVPQESAAREPQTRTTAPETEELVLRARAGDRAACAALCERLAPAVRAFARRRLADRASIEDFTQDVLVAFIVAVREGRIDEPAKAAGFAVGICRNFARERAKVRDRRRDAVERFGDFPEATLPREPELLDRARLEDCLSQLTGRARKILLASYYAESSDAEIAAEQSLSAANVRVIRHRSIAALRGCIETEQVTWEEGR